ncbi:MAG: aspartate aminotransferase, partial [Gammaproteobacteria bacterium]|nr:aspartate aminotransferase [Gammaproteobacteria bacterium]
MTEFDRRIDRSGTGSAKWDKYQGRDVLPFWVADMDFEAPGFLLDALRARLE